MLKGKFKIIAFLMLSVCSALIITGVYFYIKEEAFLKECRLIKCRVTNIDEKVRGTAVLTFKDINGNYKSFNYVEKYDYSEDDLDYKVNEIYEVYYYEKEPKRSEVKDFIGNHTTSFVFVIIGLSFIIDIPIFFFVFSMKNRQNLSQSQFGIKDDVISE